jgi:hypothetical protein
MKSILFLAFALALPLWNCDSAAAQAAGGGNAAAGEAENAATEDKGGVRTEQPDVNEAMRRAEYERLRAIGRERPLSREERDKRQEELLKMRKERLEEREKGRADQLRADLGKGVDPQQRLKVLEAQTAKEEAKHLKRMARLNRIQQLAAAEASEQVITRVKALIMKEQMRYDRSRQRTDMRKRMLMRMQEGTRQDRPAPKRGTADDAARRAMEKSAPARGSGRERPDNEIQP